MLIIALSVVEIMATHRIQHVSSVFTFGSGGESTEEHCLRPSARIFVSGMRGKSKESSRTKKPVINRMFNRVPDGLHRLFQQMNVVDQLGTTVCSVRPISHLLPWIPEDTPVSRLDILPSLVAIPVT